MEMVNFLVNGNQRQGYLALPKSGKGRGVLVLHAWWGLNDFFKTTCDRLAAQGFVAFAPDLHHGRLATTIEEANHLLEMRDFPATQATADTALHLLQDHPAVQGDKLGALGFSMGAAYAMLLDATHPGNFSGIVLFYGESGSDLSGSQAKIQCHYAEQDDWEPLENVKQMSAPNAEIHTYPNTSHWFFEEDRPDAYKADAAATAWKRTVEFFKQTLA